MHNPLFRRVFLVTTSLILLGGPVSAQTTLAEKSPLSVPTLTLVAGDARTSGPQSFIDTVARRGINFLSDPNMSATQQRQSFRALLNDSFDLETIGRFALGRYWRVATPAERAEYQHLFKKMVIDIYAQRFSTYDGQKLETTNAKPVSDTDTVVSSVIIPKDGGEKVKVDWRVRKSGSRYRVVDVVVEGVSMSVTQRSDFASVIQRGGGEVSALIKHLRLGPNSTPP